MGKKKGGSSAAGAGPKAQGHADEVSGRTQQQQQKLQQVQQMPQNPRGAKLPVWVGRGDILYVHECQAGYNLPALTTISDVAQRMSEPYDTHPVGHELRRTLPTMPHREFPDAAVFAANVVLEEHAESLAALTLLQDLSSRWAPQRRDIAKALVEVRHGLARVAWFADTARVRQVLATEGEPCVDGHFDDVDQALTTLHTVAAAFSSVAQMATAVSITIAGSPLRGCWQYRCRLGDLDGWKELEEQGRSAGIITTYSALRIAPGSEDAAEEALKAKEPSSPTPVSSMVRSGPAIPMRALMALMEASVHAMPAGLRGKEAYPCRFPENERPQLRFA